MHFEKSCGAVVYRVCNPHIEYLVIRMQQGHFSLPKGHVEARETELQTARREIKEETNLTVTIHHGFRHVVTYPPSPGVQKDVVFFVAKYRFGDVLVQQDEVSDSYWLRYDDAMSRLTYDTDREVLQKADQYLHQRASSSKRFMYIMKSSKTKK